MNEFVKALFLTLLGTTVALVLYYVFFGQVRTGGVGLFRSSTSNESWKGLMFYAAEAIETPISMYYYNYCYLPTALEYSYLDRDLGYVITEDTKNLTYLDTTGTVYGGVSQYVDERKGDGTTSVSKYSTGWK